MSIHGRGFEFNPVVLTPKQENDMPTASSTTSTQSATAPATRTARKKSRRATKKKLMTKIRGDAEFAKGYFEARSKRSTEKKAKFRKKKSRKKA